MMNNSEVKEVKQFYPKTRKEWRAWLRKNHKKEKRIAVIRYKKHTRKPSPGVMELMHEAICWGWIDTTVNRMDSERYLINYVRRNEKSSRWSDNTQRYARELIKQGLMSPHGLKMFELGLKKPTHDSGIPKNPDAPKDLLEELNKKKNKIVLNKFNSLAPSYKRVYFRWIERAKLKETRERRIKEVIRMIGKGYKGFGV